MTIEGCLSSFLDEILRFIGGLFKADIEETFYEQEFCRVFEISASPHHL